MNLFQSINSAMDVALQSDPSAGTVHMILHEHHVLIKFSLKTSVFIPRHFKKCGVLCYTLCSKICV